ncbi:MAG: PAS domain-containing protein [Magnetospiraceae bacterium]
MTPTPAPVSKAEIWRQPAPWIGLCLILVAGGLLLSLLVSALAATGLFVGALGVGGVALRCAWQERRAAAQARLLAAAHERDPRGLAICDDNGMILVANGAVRALLPAAPGTEARPLVEWLADAALKADGADAIRRLGGTAAGGSTDHMEIAVKGHKGGRRWLSVSVAPVPGADGYVQWSLQDITARREMDAVRHAGAQLMEDLVDNMPVGFFSADAEGRFYYLNRCLADWLGLPAGHMADDAPGLADFVVPDDDTPGAPSRTEADDRHGMVTLRAAKGDPFKALLLQSEQLGADGEFVYSRSVLLRDVESVLETTGAAATGAAGEWEKLFRALFSDAPVGIVQLDLDGIVTDCNKAFQKLLGLHREGIVGRPLSDRVAKEDHGDLAAQLSKVLMRTIPAAVLDVRMPATRQREVAATVYASRIDDSQGETEGLALHFIDTTERRHLQQQFTQAQKVQAVGQLAGGIAHDFNNLLTAMIGFCDLLLGRHGPGDPSFTDIMQIKQNANRAANLVRQLLAFSRRQTLQPKIVNVSEVLADLSNLLRRLIGEKIDLALEPGRDPWPVRVDPGQLDQVIVNLAVNARDAMTDGGTLTIRSANETLEEPAQIGSELIPQGDYVTIEVGDTGSGISKENIGRVFEPFFTTKNVGEGTGLGLSTVQGIIHQTGGYITVDSAPGAGAIFVIYLPADDKKAAASNEPVALTESRTLDLTGAGTILLVEDEDAVRLFASRALSNKGYQVLEAENGEAALDLVRARTASIDLVVSDVVMPGMDGHALVKQLRKERPGIKVILISGYTQDAIPEEIGRDESLNFLNKPFSLNELAGKVKTVMEAPASPLG